LKESLNFDIFIITILSIESVPVLNGEGSSFFIMEFFTKPYFFIILTFFEIQYL